MKMPVNGLRLLVVRQPDEIGRRSKFVEALAQRTELVGVVYPQVSRLQRKMVLARTVHPRRSRWSARAGFDRRTVVKRTSSVQRGLHAHRGDHDLVMQFQTLCAPGHDREGVPYAIYTDNTMALTQRHYPAWAPLSRQAADRWLRFEEGVFQGASAVFTYSEFTRRSVIEDYGCPESSVVAAGAGANQSLSSLEQKSYSVPRALFVGYEFKRKGGAVLLEAWPMVLRRIPDAELVIAGPTRPPRRPLPAGVRWVGGADRRELGELYRSASVFAMPSLFEPWGHVFVEAMAHGLPCIGTQRGAMPEIIDDGVSGLIVAAGEPEPLADALVELLSDPDKSARMGKAAFAAVQREFLWSHVADRVLAQLASQPAGALTAVAS
jgi:glycosyltransferase involved in cell wall biosynthesis